MHGLVVLLGLWIGWLWAKLVSLRRRSAVRTPLGLVPCNACGVRDAGRWSFGGIMFLPAIATSGGFRDRHAARWRGPKSDQGVGLQGLLRVSAFCLLPWLAGARAMPVGCLVTARCD